MSLAGFDAKAVAAVRDALRADGGGLCAQHVADSLDRALTPSKIEGMPLPPGSAPHVSDGEQREVAPLRLGSTGGESPYERFCIWLLGADLGYYAPYGSDTRTYHLTPAVADRIAQMAQALFGATNPCSDHSALVCEREAEHRERRAREQALTEAEAVVRYLPGLSKHARVEAAGAVREMHGGSPCMVPESEARRLAAEVRDLSTLLNRVISERDALKEHNSQTWEQGVAAAEAAIYRCTFQEGAGVGYGWLMKAADIVRELLRDPKRARRGNDE